MRLRTKGGSEKVRAVNAPMVMGSQGGDHRELRRLLTTRMNGSSRGEKWRMLFHSNDPTREFAIEESIHVMDDVYGLGDVESTLSPVRPAEV